MSIVGQYCEYEHKTVDKSAQSETFEDYKKTLRLVCSDEGRAGYLIWTVEQDTPDTVYYQVSPLLNILGINFIF